MEKLNSKFTASLTSFHIFVSTPQTRFYNLRENESESLLYEKKAALKKALNGPFTPL